MKIYSASKEDILRRQQENENWYNEQNERYKSQLEKYGEANKSQMEKFEQAVYDKIGQFVEPLGLNISVRNSHWSSLPNYRLIVECHRGEMFEDTTALVWSYNVNLNCDGVVEKQTGCATGLNATNDVQTKDLKLSIECLETLNSIDWESLMQSIIPPEKNDYITVEDPGYQYNYTKNQLNEELLETEVEDIIGKNCLIKMHNDHGLDYWIKIFRETSKQYEIGEISDMSVGDDSGWSNEEISDYLNRGKYRVSKTKILTHLVTPVEIKTLG